MTPEAYVILPDGSLDPNSAHLINEDVELVPLEPDVAVVRLSGGTELNIEYGPYPGKPPIPWPSESSFTYEQFYELDGEVRDVTRFVYERDRYVAMRLAGQSAKMAEMLATQSFPGVKTDSIFNEGKFSGTAGRNQHEELWLRQQAEAAGVSTTGKWYSRGLASYPGDPTAWVDSRNDVVRIAKEKNMTVHGYVEHKGHEVDPGDDLAIADDIVDNEVADILDSNPWANAEAVREEVYNLRSGAVDPNPLLVQD